MRLKGNVATKVGSDPINLSINQLIGQKYVRQLVSGIHDYAVHD